MLAYLVHSADCDHHDAIAVAVATRVTGSTADALRGSVGGRSATALVGSRSADRLGTLAAVAM